MSDSFRIVVIGQAAFGKSVLDALVEKGEEVVGVFCAPDKEGAPPDPIKAGAEAHAIPVFQFKRMRGQDAIDAFQALTPDLCVMAFVTQIVPPDIIEAPTRGTIQYHPSLLPEHRGPSSINWPIIQGKTRTGLSIFWPDEGLDTGPILMQKEVDIEPDDTLGSVYFNKLFPLGVEAMLESVQLVKDGTAPKVEQDHSKMTYESWCKAEDAAIDWDTPASDLYNLVRGSEPSPGANSTLDGKRVKFFKARKLDGDTGKTPGEVVEVSEDGFKVACRGGALFVGRVQPEGEGKAPASEWATSIGLKAGDRFGG